MLKIQYKSLFLLLFSMNIVMTIAYCIYHFEPNYYIQRILSCTIFSSGTSLLICKLYQIIENKTRFPIIWVIIVGMFLLLTTEAFLFYSFRALIYPGILLSLLDTNINEAHEFLSEYVLMPSFVIFIFSSILIWAIVFNFFVWLSRHCTICVPPHIKIIALYTMLSIYVLQHLYFSCINNYGFIYPSYSLVERFITSSAKTFHSNSTINRLYKALAQEAIVVHHEKSDTIPNVILIIGESVTRHYLNSYGYPLNNTPFIQMRKANGELLQFDSITSPASITIYSMQDVLTFHDSESQQEWYHYHSLPSIMRAAGYETFWISNQENIYKNVTTTIANTAKHVTYTKHYSGQGGELYDESLLPLLDSLLLHNNSSQKFICIHQMGCHSQYSRRYPQSFRHFTTDSIQRSIDESAKTIIAQYNNAILYNDYVNHEIIKRFEDKDAIVIYFSDHGEEVYETRSMFGHVNMNPSLPMLEIPLYIWSSSSFKERHYDIIKKLSQQTNKPYNTANLIHTIMDICGIRSTDFNKEKSLLNDSRHPQHSSQATISTPR